MVHGAMVHSVGRVWLNSTQVDNHSAMNIFCAPALLHSFDPLVLCSLSFVVQSSAVDHSLTHRCTRAERAASSVGRAPEKLQLGRELGIVAQGT